MASYDAAVRAAEQIIGAIEDDLPEEKYLQADDFFDSVLERTKGILETVQRTGRVSDRQFEALQNMYDGVSKWFQ
jgi:hypothetical protein